jgi:uncharacterized membrane protein
LEAQKQSRFHLLACVSLVSLIALDLLWEMLLAPLRPGGSWLALKVLPLVWIARRVFKRDNYTMQWSSMLILLYFMEGVVRGASDKLALSAALGWGEVVLSILYFIACLAYLRPHKQAAKLAAKQAVQQADHKAAPTAESKADAKPE